MSDFLEIDPLIHVKVFEIYGDSTEVSEEIHPVSRVVPRILPQPKHTLSSWPLPLQGASRSSAGVSVPSNGASSASPSQSPFANASSAESATGHGTRGTISAQPAIDRGRPRRGSCLHRAVASLQHRATTSTAAAPPDAAFEAGVSSVGSTARSGTAVGRGIAATGARPGDSSSGATTAGARVGSGTTPRTGLIALLRATSDAGPATAVGVAQPGRKTGLRVGPLEGRLALVIVGVHCSNIRQTVGPLHSPGTSGQCECIAGRTAQLNAGTDVAAIEPLTARSDISISQVKRRPLLSQVAPVQLADKGPVRKRTARRNRIDRI